MTNSILNVDTDQNTNTNDQDDKTNYLDMLVGDDKKYKDVNILAKSAHDKDMFIEQLKHELSGLRSELDTRMTLEQYLDKMGKTDSNTNTEDDSQRNQNENNRSDNIQNKDVDIDQLLEKKLAEREQQATYQRNVAEVKKKLSETFGQNYLPKLKEVASTLNVTPEELDKLAAERPSLFFKVVGIDSGSKQQNSVFVAPTGATNTMSARTESTERTKSYYDSIKKQDAKLYWSPKIQNQLHNDAIRLGERFFD